MKQYTKNAVISIFILITVALPFSSTWLFETFDGLSMEEIVFHIKVPMVGANNDFFNDFLTTVFPKVLFIFFVVMVLRHLLINRFSKNDQFKTKIKLLIVPLCIAVFSYYSVTIINQFGVVSYIKDNIKQSTFFEENYVKVTPDNLTYPENDRNLIYIFVESFESTFTSKEKGGGFVL